MEVQGKVVAIMPEKVINEKFKKREIVIETQDNFPQLIPAQFVNDKTNLADKLTIGGMVTAHINLKGKKYQSQKTGEDNYFLSLEIWKIDIEPVSSSPKSPSQNEDDMPF